LPPLLFFAISKQGFPRSIDGPYRAPIHAHLGDAAVMQTLDKHLTRKLVRRTEAEWPGFGAPGSKRLSAHRTVERKPYEEGLEHAVYRELKEL
jgi:hypothetical protein